MWDLAVPHDVHPKPGKNWPFLQFRFNFGHNKAKGFAVPLFPARLNPQRASHKAKGLSHKIPSLRSAISDLYFVLRCECTMIFFPIIILWNLLADLIHCRAETALYTFCLFMAPTILHLFQAYLLLAYLLGYACTSTKHVLPFTIQSSMGQIILVRAKTFYIVHVTASLNTKGRWDLKMVTTMKRIFLIGKQERLSENHQWWKQNSENIAWVL